MSIIDFDASRRDVIAQADPMDVRVGGLVITVPGAMPAEADIARMNLKRIEREADPDILRAVNALDQGDDEAEIPDAVLERRDEIRELQEKRREANEQLARAVLGKDYEEVDQRIPEWELADFVGFLIGMWMDRQQDPTRLRRLVRRAKSKDVTPVTVVRQPVSSNGRSSNGGGSSRRISSASTASTSPGPSSSSPGSLPGGSTFSSGASRSTR